MNIGAEANLNNIVYTVYTWPAVCTVKLINTWRQAGNSRGFVDNSEDRKTEYRYTGVHIESVPG